MFEKANKMILFITDGKNQESAKTFEQTTRRSSSQRPRLLPVTAAVFPPIAPHPIAHSLSSPPLPFFLHILMLYIFSHLRINIQQKKRW